MAYIGVTCSHSSRVVVVKGLISTALMSKIGEAFTTDYDAQDPLHVLLRHEFGTRAFRKFCADTTGLIFRLTFSVNEKPRLLIHDNTPISILGADADPFEIHLQDVDIVNGGATSRRQNGVSFVESLPQP